MNNKNYLEIKFYCSGIELTRYIKVPFEMINDESISTYKNVEKYVFSKGAKKGVIYNSNLLYDMKIKGVN